MCGRFTLISSPRDLQLAFEGFVFPDELALEARYNIPPSLDVLYIPNDGEKRAGYARWGLIPFWAKDPSIGNRTINARAETVDRRPAYRDAFRKRRCLVPADGFYEWKKAEEGPKTPFYIRLQSGAPFAFAGIWERWRDGDGNRVVSCAILTTKPNEKLAEIHDRMPVILPADAYEDWLTPDEARAEDLAGCLRPYPADRMVAHPVSRLVNSPKNDEPACTEPVEDSGAGGAQTSLL